LRARVRDEHRTQVVRVVDVTDAEADEKAVIRGLHGFVFWNFVRGGNGRDERDRPVVIAIGDEPFFQAVEEHVADLGRGFPDFIQQCNVARGELAPLAFPLATLDGSRVERADEVFARDVGIEQDAKELAADARRETAQQRGLGRARRAKHKDMLAAASATATASAISPRATNWLAT